MNHMIYRINAVITMMMGEVDMEILKMSNSSKFVEQIITSDWKSVDYSGHLIVSVFCLTVPILILNVLTAFAIKVCLTKLRVSH